MAPNKAAKYLMKDRSVACSENMLLSLRCSIFAVLRCQFIACVRGLGWNSLDHILHHQLIENKRACNAYCYVGWALPALST
ncbi:hypothetical protein NIES4071_14330 [Calothrix sp. NIES-4071]|nr:hypothetical protein NIES4071_14330 [Calothrix sp. NIES-4071]BAZ55771.1 hypothetical protein NIES4105_14280 [Calothrix sp. NIES-4105]